MKQNPWSRREFLRRSLFTVALPTIIPAAALGRDGHTPPSERITIGQIGVGDRGSYLLGELLQCPHTQVVALCDVKKDRLATAARTVNHFYDNTACKMFSEHENITDSNDIDAVIVASCDHWHVFHARAAALHGKGVYLEKPMGLSPAQDQALRKAVLENHTAFQFGTQQRSDTRFREACERVRNGILGPLREIYIWAPPSSSGGPTNKAPIPETLNYDRWLGPAPEVPYTFERDSNKWWWHITDYAVGFIAGWGIHPVDIALWGAAEAMRTPCHIEGRGTYPTEGLCNCAVAWDLTVTYEGGPTVFYRSAPDASDWKKRFGDDADHGTAFLGDRGWIQVNRRTITASDDALLKEPLPEKALRLPESRHHLRNFTEAVRTGAPTIAPIEDAVRADLFCMACDTALRLRKKLRWDPEKELFTDNPEANQHLERPMRTPWNIV